jgi:hypothetical protein
MSVSGEYPTELPDGPTHERPVQVRLMLCTLLNGIFVIEFVPEVVKVNCSIELTLVGNVPGPCGGPMREKAVPQLTKPVSAPVLLLSSLLMAPTCKSAATPLRVHWAVPDIPAEVDDFRLGVADRPLKGTVPAKIEGPRMLRPGMGGSNKGGIAVT